MAEALLLASTLGMEAGISFMAGNGSILLETPVKSVHQFYPGDRVAYSVTLAAVPEKKLRKRHVQGRGTVTRVFLKPAEPTYEVHTTRGDLRIFYAHELRLVKRNVAQ